MRADFGHLENHLTDRRSLKYRKWAKLPTLDRLERILRQSELSLPAHRIVNPRAAVRRRRVVCRS